MLTAFRNTKMQEIALTIPVAGSIPHFAHTADAAADLVSSSSYTIDPHSRVAVGCGLVVAIPRGYAGLIMPRSGLALKHGITVLNAPGVIDSGYRGEVKVILYNSDKSHTYTVNSGDKVAQLMIIKLLNIRFMEEQESNLPKGDERGAEGFGSSGY